VLERDACYASKRSGAMFVITKVPDETSGDVEIERVLLPGMGFFLPHVHLDFDEGFRVVEGVADAWIGRRRIRLGRGDEFLVTRHDTHVNPLNRSARPLVICQRFSPGTRGARRWIEAFGACLNDDRDVRGDLAPLAAMSITAGREPQTFAPGVPQSLQRHVIFPLARSIEHWRKDRRSLKEEEREAARAAQYGYWAEDSARRRSADGGRSTG
jgi:mannose-6-phosphate isomerase-like protein (cupin superfamily)